MRINSLLAPILASSPAITGLSPASRQIPQVGGQAPVSTPLPTDSFKQGQWWATMARSAVSDQATAAKTCACGSCSSCATRAYQESSRLGQPVSGGRSVDADPQGLGVQAAEEGRLGQEGEPEADQPGSLKGANGQALSQSERLELAQLVQADTRVKAHEMAHLSAAGPYARSGAQFQYARGPDGRQYAVAGEVSIDTGKESTPEATLSKMQTVRAAALAPADPSPQDRKVAAMASLLVAEASQDLQMIRLEQSKSATNPPDGGDGTSPSSDETEAVFAREADEPSVSAASPALAARQVAGYQRAAAGKLPSFSLAV